MTGKVKAWNGGFGFIERPQGCDRDVFVHCSACPDRQPLKVGDLVSYEVEESPKGPRAAKVRVIQPTHH